MAADVTGGPLPQPSGEEGVANRSRNCGVSGLHPLQICKPKRLERTLL